MKSIHALKAIWKKEWLEYLLSLLFLSVSSIVCSFLFYDEKGLASRYGSLDVLTGMDQYVITVTGVKGTTMQTYVFFTIVWTFVTIAYLLLWTYLSYSKHRNDLMLLHVRGYGSDKSTGLFCIWRIVLFVPCLAFGYAVDFAFVELFFVLSGCDHQLFFVSPMTLIFSGIFFVFFAISDVIFNSVPYQEKKILSFLRENY